MADLIAEFAASLKFEAGPFKKSLDEAEKKAKEAAEKSAKAWEKFGSTLRTVGLGALGAVGGIAALVDKSVASAAAIDDVSKRTGAAARDLQRLKFAAEQSGSGLGAIEGALKTLDRALIKGAKDAGPIAESLRALGLTTTELIDLPAEAKFAAVAEALAKIENPALQTKAAMDLFGGSGAELLPLLQEGAAGIRKLGDEAETAGLVMSDAAIDGAAKFDDELGKLKSQAGAVSRDIGLALIPVVRGLTKDTGTATTAVLAFGAAFAGAKLIQLPGQLGLAASSMGTLALRTAGATTAALALGVALGTALDNALGLSDAIANVDQQQGGQGAVALSDLTDGERSKLTGAQARLAKAQEALDSGAGGAFRELAAREANAARAEIDAVQNAARGRKRGTEGLRKSLGGVDTFVGRSAGEAAIERGLKAGESANARARKLGKGKGKGGAKKSGDPDIDASVFEFDESNGDELRRLAARHGIGEVGIDAALKAGAESLASGATAHVARNAALSRLGANAGVDLTVKSTKDPLLSQIFGDEQVPDVELSSIARGAEPQVLISNITNTFNQSFDIAVDGARSPGEVADHVVGRFTDLSRDGVAKATKTAKVNYAR